MKWPVQAPRYPCSMCKRMVRYLAEARICPYVSCFDEDNSSPVVCKLCRQLHALIHLRQDEAPLPQLGHSWYWWDD